jgi:hypothetical protein
MPKPLREIPMSDREIAKLVYETWKADGAVFDGVWFVVQVKLPEAVLEQFLKRAETEGK